MGMYEEFKGLIQDDRPYELLRVKYNIPKTLNTQMHIKSKK